MVSYAYCDSLGQDLQLNDDHLYGYADHLYKNGEYYRAITEYKRLLFFFPASDHSKSARFQIGRSYMAGDLLDEATRYWKQQLNASGYAPEDFQQIRILLGISFLDLNREELLHFREKNIKEAISLFAELEDSQEPVRLITGFSNEWQNRDHNNRKTPWLAGSLSAMLPGAGSFYNGRYLEGIYSFFITGLFYLATRDAISREQNELSIALGLITVGFYGSNIYTAVNGAHKLNEKQETEELLRIRQKYGIWFIPATERHPGQF